MEKRAILVAMLAGSLFLTGCSWIEKADNVPQGTPAPIIKPMEIIAQATATPEPEIIIRDAIISRTPMIVHKDVPADVEIPYFYNLVDLDGIPYAVYAYSLQSDVTEFRVYGETNVLEDGNVIETKKGFFKAYIYVENGMYRLETNNQEEPIEQWEETPSVLTTCYAPTKNNITKYVKGANAAAKKYEQEVAAAEKKGEPAPEPTPYDGTPILTSATTPITLPKKLRAVKGIANLYYYVNAYGQKEYRRYCSYNAYGSGFYVSDSEGTVKEGSLIIDSASDFTKERFKARKAIEAPEDGLYRCPVWVVTTDNNWDVVNMVYTK